MSRAEENARRALKEFTRTHYHEQGEVLSVDEQAYTCVVKLPQGNELPDVMLKALREAEKGAVMIPAIGSTVQLLCVGEPEWMVIAADEISKVIWYVDGTKLEVTKDVFKINDGANGGVPIASNVVDRLNKVEEDLNTLRTKLISWVVAPNDGGAALRTALTGVLSGPAIPGSWAYGKIEKTILKDIENPKVKH